MEKIIELGTKYDPTLILEPLTEKLNAQQEEAIQTLTGRHVICAGAGTGKSSVLVARMRRIKEIFPQATVLMLAFSRAAAIELKSRVGEVAGVRISTIHSLSYHILKSSGCKFRVDTNGENQISMINALISSRCKTTLEEVLKSLHEVKGASRSTLRVRQKYLKKLQENHIVTFDTMINLAVKLLKKNAGMRNSWQNRYDFVQIDEGQDLDSVQVELLELLTGKSKNLCVAGDVRQQIYSFRGANNAMEKLSQGASQHELTINYRCNAAILKLANGIMTKYAPLMSASKMIPLKPEFFTAKDSKDEAKFVADEIEKLREVGQSYKDMSVLYRSSSVSNELVQELLNRKIPFVTSSVMLSKYKSRPYREIIAILKYMSDMTSTEKLKEILPIFYLKRSRISEIESMVPELKNSLVSVLPLLTSKPRHYSYVEELSSSLEYAVKLEPAQAIRHMMKHGLQEYFGETMTLSVETVITELQEFSTPESFLTHLDELEEQIKKMRELTSRTDNLVELSTIHAAKGKEWNNVFIIGCAEGIIPSEREYSDVEEERRIMYVGVTRAKEKLWLSYPKFSETQIEQNKPSQFLTGLF